MHYPKNCVINGKTVNPSEQKCCWGLKEVHAGDADYPEAMNPLGLQAPICLPWYQ